MATGAAPGGHDRAVQPAKSTFYLQESNTAGLPDVVVPFQPTADVCTPVVGDWSGGGADKVGLYDPQPRLSIWRFQHSGDRILHLHVRADQCPLYPARRRLDRKWHHTVGLYDPKTTTFYNGIPTLPAAAVRQSVCSAGVRLDCPCRRLDRQRHDTVGLIQPADIDFLFSEFQHRRCRGLRFTYGPAGAGWIPLAGQWNETGAAVTAPMHGDLEDWHSGPQGRRGRRHRIRCRPKRRGRGANQRHGRQQHRDAGPGRGRRTFRRR